MDVSRKKAERLCEIVLSDASDPLPNGLRFNICLTDDSDSIRLSAFHDLASLPMFLAASARVQQFAKAGPLEDKDADAFKQLGTYMKNRSLVKHSLSPLNDRLTLLACNSSALTTCTTMLY